MTRAVLEEIAKLFDKKASDAGQMSSTANTKRERMLSARDQYTWEDAATILRAKAGEF